MMTRKEMSNSSDTAHAVLAYAGTRDRPDDPVRVWGGHASGPDTTYRHAANRRGVSGTRDALASRTSGGIARCFMGGRPRPRRSSPRCFFPTSYGAGGHELCLEPPEWTAHEAVRVRLRGGLALVRGCLKPGDRWGMCLSLRALETGTGTVCVVQLGAAPGAFISPRRAACTLREARPQAAPGHQPL